MQQLQHTSQSQMQQQHQHQPPVQNGHGDHNSTPATIPSAWQSLAAPGSTVADYLSHLPASTLPLSLHHFLKYSAETMKKETAQQQLSQGSDPNINLLHLNTGANCLSNNG